MDKVAEKKYDVQEVDQTSLGKNLYNLKNFLRR
jgi:hypothetical protein